MAKTNTAKKPAPARLTVHDTPAQTPAQAPDRPSEQIIRESLSELTTVDARGRTLVFGKPPILQQSRYMRLLSPDDARNEAFITTFFLPATWIKSIDGEKILPPQSMSELEAIIQRLDYDGQEAILKKFEELGQSMIQTREEAQAEVKK